MDSSREGMLEGFSLGSYLLLVNYTGRLFRTGKATISAELAGIFDRLGSSAESWRARLEKLRTRRLFGRFFAASREKLREAAVRLNVRRESCVNTGYVHQAQEAEVDGDHRHDEHEREDCERGTLIHI